MKEKSVLILPVLALVVLCSCGVRSTDISKTPEKEVEVATASAITAVFKNSDTSEKTETLKNDFIRVYDAGDYEWEQENLDGTGQQELQLEKLEKAGGYVDVWWLTNDWMYIESEDDKGTSMIARIPVDCEAQPMFDTENMEILIEDIDIVDDLLVTDSYLFYLEYNNKEDSMTGYRYDFNTKENKRVFESKKDYCEMNYDYNYDLPLVVGNNFILSGEDNLYVISLDTLESKIICSGEFMDESLLAEYEDVLYFTQGERDSIYKYDGENTTCLIEEKAFHKIVDEMDLADKNAIDAESWIADFNIINDQLYALVDVEWYSKEKWVEGPHKGESVRKYRSQMYLLSTGINDFNEWELDDTLAEFMINNFEPDNMAYDACDNQKHMDAYRTDINDSVDTMVDEVNFLYGNQIGIYTGLPNGKEAFFVYDIATGKIRQVDEDEYYDSYYSETF